MSTSSGTPEPSPLEVQELFLAVRRLSMAECESLLQSLLDKKPALVREVRELLAFDTPPTSDLLEELATNTIPTNENRASALSSSSLPEHLGPYRILERIGEGGFGEVFLAEQRTPLLRRVAVKWVKPGMDSRRVLARFDAERQALARMNHPGIATVLDAGVSDDGRPYFAMELVRGKTITEFCTERDVTLEQRIQLICQVCRAAHHAHQRGVLHRDIKPGNLLVTMDGQKPIVKIIDFGIAKALDSQLTDQTVYTEWRQMLGTLEYMSPEQADPQGTDIDVRSDVYAIGVVLYQLLTGAPPIDRQTLLTGGLWDLGKTLKRLQPELPSNRLSKKIHSDSPRLPGTSDTASLAHEQPKLLSSVGRIKGDLDLIVMTALAKDRDLRYQSPRELEEDLERWMRGDPIAARAPSWSYTVAMWAQRHRWIVSALLLIAVSAAVALGGLVYGYKKSQEYLQKAIRQSQEAEASAEEALIARNLVESQRREIAQQSYPLMIESAWSSYRQYRFDQSQLWLDRCEPNLRGWEWNLISNLIKQPNHRTLRELESSKVLNLAQSADGTTVYWETAERRLQQGPFRDNSLSESENNVGPPTLRVRRIACSPIDKDLLAAGNADASEVLLLSRLGDNWDISATLPLQAGGIYEIKFQPDGKKIGVLTGDGSLFQIDPSQRVVERKWELGSRCGSLEWHSQRRSWIATGLDGAIYAALNDSSLEVKRTAVSEETIVVAKILSSGTIIAGDSSGRIWKLVGDDSPMLIENLQTGIACSKLRPPLALTGDLQKASDSGVATAESLWMGLSNGMIVRWSVDAATDTLANRTTIASFDTSLIDFEVVGEQTLIAALADGRVVTMPLPLLSTLLFQPDSIRGVLPQQESGVSILFASYLLSKTPTGQWKHTNNADVDLGIWTIAGNPNDKFFFQLTSDLTLEKVALPSLSTLSSHEIQLGARALAIDPKSTRLAGPVMKLDVQSATPIAAAREGTIGLYDATSLRLEKALIGHTNWVIASAFSDDGETLVTASVDLTIRGWDVVSGNQKWTQSLPGSPQPTCLTISSPDSVWVGFDGGQLAKFKLTTGELLEKKSIHGDHVEAIAAIPSQDRLLVSARSDSKLQIFRNVDGSEVVQLPLSIGPIAGISVRPDGRDLLIVGKHGISLGH